MQNRTLYLGNNIQVLKELRDDFVDLVYIDPPFLSKKTYFAPEKSKAKGISFQDYWDFPDNEIQYLKPLYYKYPELLKAFCLIEMVHSLPMGNYIRILAIRLAEIKRVLKNTGSIYLHCDDTISHYLKIVMDTIFGHKNFRNQIIWKRHTGPKTSSKILGRNYDTLLFYSKTNKYTFNTEGTFIPHNDPDLLKKYNHIEAETGRRYNLYNLNISALSDVEKDEDSERYYEVFGHTKHWMWTKERMMKAIEDGLVIQPSEGALPYYKKYLDESEGQKIDNVWDDIPSKMRSKQNEGYPKQKPIKLLERILKLSSVTDGLVLDPFCGSGTTCIAAERLGRKWIGIDNNELTINYVKQRFDDEFGIMANAVDINTIRVF